jgi:hypothetical protein
VRTDNSCLEALIVLFQSPAPHSRFTCHSVEFPILLCPSRMTYCSGSSLQETRKTKWIAFDCACEAAGDVNSLVRPLSTTGVYGLRNAEPVLKPCGAQEG